MIQKKLLMFFFFASMDSPNDPSTAFKIDAILLDKNEIEKIKKENKKVAEKSSTLQSNLENLIISWKCLNLT